MDYITDLLEFDEQYQMKEALDHILRKSNAKDIFFCKLKPNFNFTFRPEQNFPKHYHVMICIDINETLFH